MRGPANGRFRLLPVRSLAPNILTILALCAGLTALRFALQSKWEPAVLAIVVAIILDGLDGRLARFLQGATKFGAELDSLSDMVAFGVAPAVIIYLWTLADLRGVGWIIAMGYAVCCALRLARFNTAKASEDEAPSRTSDFFVGVPAPSGAGLALLPMMIEFETGVTLFRNPVLCAVFVAIVSFLMISRLPTLSFKRLGVRRDQVLPVLLFVTFIAALATSYLWGMLAVIGVTYIIMLPVGYRRHQQALAAPSPTVAASEDASHGAERPAHRS